MQSHFAFVILSALVCSGLCGVSGVSWAQGAAPLESGRSASGGDSAENSQEASPYADEEADAEDSAIEDGEDGASGIYKGVEEITVTGSASGILQSDAAESAVQFDSEELDALGATELTDIARVTPNLQITQAGATSASFFIRGVGLADFSANSASAVAVYQDGVPLNASALQLAGIFDLQNLAVLRGPQAWGSTRNASAGAIKLQSQMPTGEYHANLMTTFGSYWSDVANSALIQRY
ncbi:TonB-dependent receptor plug domain-containing protein, partial [Myxococcota bacterium]|nr:TonB-dependent receptor plug domain-containing protein [Myxococcota bacterium]